MHKPAPPGAVFNSLTVIKYIPGKGKRRAQYKVKCKCGKITFMRSDYLISRQSKKCIECWNKKLVLPGTVFNSYTVLEHIPGKGKQVSQYRVKCKCGNISWVDSANVKSGKTKQCRNCAGKQKSVELREKYGYEKHMPDDTVKLSWLGRHDQMMQRCYNQKRESYPDYGGRGITVCERWHNRLNYIKDISKLLGYDNMKLQLDRTNNDAGYSPENCQMVTRKENNSNRRCSPKNQKEGPLVSFFGKSIPAPLPVEEEEIEEFTF